MIRAACLALLLAACGTRETSQNKAVDAKSPPAASPTSGAATRAEAIAAADTYLAAHHMRIAPVIYVIDMGDRWRLSYEDRPGEGGTGGPIIAVVNKRSGEVVHMETEQ
jgi:hypothetical protein